MSAIGSIPRNRLAWIPRECQLAHNYCYFLHDQSVHLLKQYEAAQAHHITVKLQSKVESARFAEIANNSVLKALRATGYPTEARRVVFNTITMAMVSDTLHHLFEALKCLEKRKSVVALNLLRKPLLDSLIYLAWMLGDEDGFYSAFTSGDPTKLSPKVLGNNRAGIIDQALAQTEVSEVLTTEFIVANLFSSKNPSGLYGLFQKAVHLVTVDRVELKTEAENFNFIFKNYADDDIYHGIYYALPYALLFLTHVMLELFDRIEPMDIGAKKAFKVRSILGLYLVEGGDNEVVAIKRLSALGEHCSYDCGTPLKITRYNAARISLSESYRCTGCRRVKGFPLSWMF